MGSVQCVQAMRATTAYQAATVAACGLAQDAWAGQHAHVISRRHFDFPAPMLWLRSCVSHNPSCVSHNR
eukprot:365578-Chlamydomonas_euryale.AAC.23